MAARRSKAYAALLVAWSFINCSGCQCDPAQIYSSAHLAIANQTCCAMMFLDNSAVLSKYMYTGDSAPGDVLCTGIPALQASLMSRVGNGFLAMLCPCFGYNNLLVQHQTS